MAEIRSQDQLARLNALASGGSGVLAQYDQAVAQQQQYQQSALDSVLSRPQNMGIKPGEAWALGGEIAKQTQPYTDDARSARNLATSQVGYDQQAVTTYLTDVQEKLDETRRQQNEKNALDQYQFESQMESKRRYLDYMRQQQELERQSGGKDLTQSAITSIIEGLAQEAQGRDVTKLLEDKRANAPREAGQAKDAAIDIAQFARDYVKNVSSLMTERGMSEQAARAAVDSSMSRLGQSGPARNVPALRGANAQRALNEAFQSLLGAGRPYAERERLSGLVNFGIDPITNQRYEVGVAPLLGMSEYEAMGRWPADAQYIEGRKQDEFDLMYGDAKRQREIDNLMGDTQEQGVEAEIEQIRRLGIGPDEAASLVDDYGLSAPQVQSILSQGDEQGLEDFMQEQIAKRATFDEAIRSLVDEDVNNELTDTELAVIAAIWRPKFELRGG